MPQMAPLSWLILFILFTISFIVFNMLNYFCFSNKKMESNYKSDKNFISMSWKW